LFLLKNLGDWGLNYNGKSGLAAAELVRKDIACAINMKFDIFNDFGGSTDVNTAKREIASFFSNVRKETGGMAAFEEKGIAPEVYCTSSSISGANQGLKDSGLNYPCQGSKDYHGRGAIQLTWNVNYGRFSEFIYGDKNILLINPELVEPTGPLGWGSSLWFWMTPQGFGGSCPPKELSGCLATGTDSPHLAMTAINGEGMGKTINIINGGYECCPKSSYRSSPVARMQSYIDFCAILKVPFADGCTASSATNAECLKKITAGCPLIKDVVIGGKSCPLKCALTSAVVWWSGSDSFKFDRATCDPLCSTTTIPGISFGGAACGADDLTTKLPPPTTKASDSTQVPPVVIVTDAPSTPKPTTLWTPQPGGATGVCNPNYKLTCSTTFLNLNYCVSQYGSCGIGSAWCNDKSLWSNACTNASTPPPTSPTTR
jgi:hypothetical protein